MDFITGENEARKFIYTILFKLIGGLEVVNLLFHNIRSKRHFSGSIYINLRVLLADMITVDYIIFKSDFKDSRFSEELQKLKFDHISNILERLKLYKILYHDSDTESELMRKNLITIFPSYFDKDGNPKVGFKKMKSISGMIREIKSGTSDSLFQQQVIQAYEHYDLYSKYEHLGHLTEPLTFRGYIEENLQEMITEIKTCILILLDFMHSLISEFYKNEVIESTTYWYYYQAIKKEN